MFFSPIRNDPKKHINKFLPPTQSRDNPAKNLVYVFFISGKFTVCTSRLRPSPIHGLCTILASKTNSRFMYLFQTALDTCPDSPLLASLSVHALHFTVYAPSRGIGLEKTMHGFSTWKTHQTSHFLLLYPKQSTLSMVILRPKGFPKFRRKKSLVSAKLFARNSGAGNGCGGQILGFKMSKSRGRE